MTKKENITETEEKVLPSLENADAYETACAIRDVLDDKKAHDIKILHVEDRTVIAHYFVICTGNSSTHIKALVNEIEYRIGNRGLKPYNIEGKDNNSWILMDYSNVIVHVFSRDAREFYNLEKLYGDSDRV